MNRHNFFSLRLFVLIFNSMFAQEIQKSVFNVGKSTEANWLIYKNNNQALYKIISNEAFRLLDERTRKVAALKTQQDWIEYQKEIKAKLFGSLTKFEKTPLNAKITGTLERENYKIEKIIFESHPNFYVTACLFLPKKSQKPAPTVIYCSGHTPLGFRSETYQRVILNLVAKGFVVFAFDPIGQGERLQYADPATGNSMIGGPTTEHSYTGAQTLLTGTSLSDYFVWDGVRAVDYLLTRKEVDPARIGITGRSGGGTQSAMIAAFDDRIYAAAPECYITNFTRLLQSIGMQDAEQNPYNFIQKGLDHPDFLHLRVPNPTLLVTTTHDFFSIQGAKETFSEVKKSYEVFGKPENIRMVEDLGGHESTRKNRESVYAFFQNNLNLPGDSTDRDCALLSIEDLQVTKTVQVGTSFKSETVFGLNKKYFSRLEIAKDDLKETISKVSGIQFNRKLTTAVYTGITSTDSFEVENYFLENDLKDFVLPVYVAKMRSSSPEKITVWLHQKGKGKIVEEKLFIELINSGQTVISADLPGVGELSDPSFKGDGFVKGVPFNYTFGANLVGKSIPGIQAEALDLLMQFIEKDHRFQEKEINALVEGTTGNAFLHYAVLKNPFSKIVLLNPLKSNLSLIQTESYDPDLAYNIVPGSLPYYDFQDMVSLLPSQSVILVNPVNALGQKEEQYDENSVVMEFFKDKIN